MVGQLLRVIGGRLHRDHAGTLFGGARVEKELVNLATQKEIEQVGQDFGRTRFEEDLAIVLFEFAPFRFERLLKGVLEIIEREEGNLTRFLNERVS